MPRARLTWYAEAVIPYRFISEVDENAKRELIRLVERKLIDKELAKACIKKLQKMQLIGEWLVELWYYEIFEDRKDEATGYNYEKPGINVWRAEWVTTAVPSQVIEMDERIVHETRTHKEIKIDNLDLRVTAYFTVNEED